MTIMNHQAIRWIARLTRWVDLIPYIFGPDESFRSPCSCSFLNLLATVLFGFGSHVLSWKHCQNCPLLCHWVFSKRGMDILLGSSTHSYWTSVLAACVHAASWLRVCVQASAPSVHVRSPCSSLFNYVTDRCVFLKVKSPVGSLWLSVIWFLIFER